MLLGNDSSPFHNQESDLKARAWCMHAWQRGAWTPTRFCHPSSEDLLCPRSLAPSLPPSLPEASSGCSSRVVAPASKSQHYPPGCLTFRASEPLLPAPSHPYYPHPTSPSHPTSRPLILPHRSVIRSRCDECTIGREGDGRDVKVVPLLLEHVGVGAPLPYQQLAQLGTSN